MKNTAKAIIHSRRAVAATLALLLTACSALAPGQRSIDISQQQLLAAIAKRFPFNTRYLDLIDLRLDTPSLTMIPETNRIGMGFTLSASDRIFRRAFAGVADMSFGLRFDAGDNTVRLAGVRVERLDITGLPEQFRGQTQRLGPFLAERFLEDTTVYAIKPEDLAQAGRYGYVPGELRVTASGLRITLNPVQRQ